MPACKHRQQTADGVFYEDRGNFVWIRTIFMIFGTRDERKGRQLMEKVIDKITLDLSNSTKETTVYAKQGDRKSHYLEVTLMAGGQIYPVRDAAAHLRARKPDGKMVYNQASVTEDGKVMAELTDQTLAVPGTVLADIQLMGAEGEILASFSFYIQVEEEITGEQIPSDSEFQAFNAAAVRAETAAVKAQNWAKNAADSASRVPEDALGAADLDRTLSQNGKPADAAAVGRKVAEITSGRPTVESGASGPWSWKKYSDGTAELYLNYKEKLQEESADNVLGHGYLKVIALPFRVKEIMGCGCTARAGSGFTIIKGVWTSVTSESCDIKIFISSNIPNETTCNIMCNIAVQYL